MSKSRNRNRISEKRVRKERLSNLDLCDIHNKRQIQKRLGNQAQPVSKSSYSAIDHPVLYHGALSHQEADAAMRVAQARTILTDKHGTILLF